MTTFERIEGRDPRLQPSDDLQVALDHLAAAAVASPESGRHRDDVTAFVRAHADAAHRTNLEGHLTGSGLVVDASGERTLLMLHRKLGRWFQPGGHADGDANLPAVALREAEEETGIDGLAVLVPAIDVDIHEVRPPEEPPHLHLDSRYLVVAPPGALEHANEESLALRWVTEAELDDLDPPVDDSTRRLVRRGLAVARTLARP
ncbi:MAG TPA: NUDIX hydrolase [Acidimicrobiales bacterium]|nr:NUDIX hydrolase [Acidimicrobiales bacterium]